MRGCSVVGMADGCTDVKMGTTSGTACYCSKDKCNAQTSVDTKEKGNAQTSVHNKQFLTLATCSLIVFMLKYVF